MRSDRYQWLLAAPMLLCGCGDSVVAENGSANGIENIVVSEVPGDWSDIAPAIGQLPSASGLFHNSPISTDLNALLGPDVNLFREAMARQTPLRREGTLLYTIGVRPEGNGLSYSYLVIDPVGHGLEVGIQTAGRWRVWRTAGAEVALPAAVAAVRG